MMAAISNANAVVSLASRFRGCLMGSHIGDCLGAPFENDNIVSKSVLSMYFEKMQKDSPGGLIQAQPYTDDTAMTYSVAQSLIEKKGVDPVDMAKKFTEEYFSQPKRGYGYNVIDVFKALKQTNYIDVFEPARLQFRGTGSYGNGAAMRIAPIALYSYHHDMETLKKLAKECALITHSHQNGYNGAILQCLAIDQALKSDSVNPTQFAGSLLEKMQTVEASMENIGSLDRKQPFCSSLKIIKDLFANGMPNLSPTSVAELLGNEVIAHRSVPTAIYSFLRSTKPLADFECDNPFIRALYLAISVGGDTDTIAAMTGSITGAYYGEDSIPNSFFPRCEDIEKSLHLANKLFSIVSNK